MSKRVARTRNCGTQTDAQYWNGIRSCLRNHFRYWKPMQDAKKLSRRLKPKRKKGRHKYEYQCNHCEEWFQEKEVQIDHIIPAGRLRSYEDIGKFVEKLTPEGIDSYQVLCKNCHQIKTNKEKQERKNNGI